MSDEVEVELDVIAQCVYCGVDLTIETLTREHVIPLVRGGVNRDYNRAPACGPCNEAKGPLTASEFFAVRDDPDDLASMIRLVLADEARLTRIKRPNMPPNKAEKAAAKKARAIAAGQLGDRAKQPKQAQLTHTLADSEAFRRMIDDIGNPNIYSPPHPDAQAAIDADAARRQGLNAFNDRTADRTRTGTPEGPA